MLDVQIGRQSRLRRNSANTAHIPFRLTSARNRHFVRAHLAINAAPRQTSVNFMVVNIDCSPDRQVARFDNMLNDHAEVYARLDEDELNCRAARILAAGDPWLNTTLTTLRSSAAVWPG